jgi:hypothetical protein
VNDPSFFDETCLPSGGGINFAESLSDSLQRQPFNEGRKGHERKICAETGPNDYQQERKKMFALREKAHREMALSCLHQA